MHSLAPSNKLICPLKFMSPLCLAYACICFYFHLKCEYFTFTYICNQQAALNVLQIRTNILFYYFYKQTTYFAVYDNLSCYNARIVCLCTYEHDTDTIITYFYTVYNNNKPIKCLKLVYINACQKNSSAILLMIVSCILLTTHVKENIQRP